MTVVGSCSLTTFLTLALGFKETFAPRVMTIRVVVAPASTFGTFRTPMFSAVRPRKDPKAFAKVRESAAVVVNCVSLRHRITVVKSGE